MGVKSASILQVQRAYQHVSQQVLRALEPAAPELSLEAAMHLEQERSDLDRLWQQRLERAAFETERALSALSTH